MKPEEFRHKWADNELKERSASQEHFIDLCRMLGQPTPAEVDKTGESYCFEKGALKTDGSDGWADVWKKGFFAWEYKGRHANLLKAYGQLLDYREALGNPPLLVVCDRDRIEVHTNFTNTDSQVHTVRLAEIGHPESLRVLRALFSHPESLRPGVTAEGVTEQAAAQVGALAERLRARGVAAHDAAHFLMKLIFCLFAEDVGLLPRGLMERLLNAAREDAGRFDSMIAGLLQAMGTGGYFGAEEVDHFNGGLFDDEATIPLQAEEIKALAGVAKLDWDRVDPSVFGTLFERSLDPGKRAQLGAHYTSKKDIEAIVEPVLMEPLRREWEEVRARCEGLWAQVGEIKAVTGQPQEISRNQQKRTKLLGEIDGAVHAFRSRLAAVRVLDPACGSGNFLYVSLNALMDLDADVSRRAVGWNLTAGASQVHPRQLRGIEIDAYAAELAQLTVWIGYLQWNQRHATLTRERPILEALETIERRDAIVDCGMAVSAMQGETAHDRDGHATGGAAHDRDGHATRDTGGDATRQGACLPHWTRDGGTYFVTFRLADALPREALEAIRFERTDITRRADHLGRALTQHEQARLADLFSERTEAYLAAGHGACWLRQPEVAEMVVGALRHFDGDRYDLIAWCLMPNHVHVVFNARPGHSLEGITHSWKSYTAHQANRMLGRTGDFWQDESYDHLVRDEDDLARCVQYVLDNPQRAGLDDWPWCGAQEAARGMIASVMQGGTAHDRDGHATGDTAHATEPVWPECDVIVGNPPFLGDKKLRGELGDGYVGRLFGLYGGRVPNQSDLCCYWFERARAEIAAGRAKRAGLLATNSIRQGKNRVVLERILSSGGIFMAWSDRDWILDGAAVRVSMVGFDDGTQTSGTLDGNAVGGIHADLTAGADLTGAKRLKADAGVSFMGGIKGGAFDIPGELARQMLALPNPLGRDNADVVRPWVNGLDVTRRPRGMWIIDFGDMPLEQAALYEAPFEHVRTNVYPERSTNRRAGRRERWWVHAEVHPAMRAAIGRLPRYVGTVIVAAHRLFVWLPQGVNPDHRLIVFAREDDYFFGVVHSRVHEVWSLATCSWQGKGNDPVYTPQTCFETFPFPVPTDEQREAVGEAARRLHEVRQSALDGDPKLTLTALYNKRPTWLDSLHRNLDAAVLEAYGWPGDLSDEGLLERLLALNLERAEDEAGGVLVRP